jgi:uncharacterized lipoprotein YmbA
VKQALLSSVMVFSGCALFSKGEVATRRFYSLDQVVSLDRAKGDAPSAELRLGRVTAGACGSERVMVRLSPVEVVFDDERRWTERPEVSLRRALSRALFEELGLASVVRGGGPVLEVELLEFEEVRGPPHVGRVTMSWSLSDERVVSRQQTLKIERPVVESGRAGDAVAEAMGAAMREAVDTMARQVRAELTPR